MGTIRPKGRGFQADVRVQNGTRLRPSFETYDQANDWLRTIEEKVRTGQDVSLDVAQSSRAVAMNLRELAEEVLNRHWRGRKSELSLWRNAKDVYQRLGASRSVREVNENVIDDLVYQLERDGRFKDAKTCVPSGIHRSLTRYRTQARTRRAYSLGDRSGRTSHACQVPRDRP